MASCMMSRGFMVSFSEDEMLCSDTVRPCPPLGPELYTLWGKAKRRATAARNISSPTKKFCQPADTVPTPTRVSPSCMKIGLITPVFSRTAKTTPVAKAEFSVCSIEAAVVSFANEQINKVFPVHFSLSSGMGQFFPGQPNYTYSEEIQHKLDQRCYCIIHFIT